MAKLFVPGGVHHVPEAAVEGDPNAGSGIPAGEEEVAEKVQMLIECLAAGRVGAFKVRRKSDDKEVTVLAGIIPTNLGNQGIAPLVEVITGNAMEMYHPPTVSGQQAKEHDPLARTVELPDPV